MGLGKFNFNNLSVTSNFIVIEKNKIKIGFLKNRYIYNK